MIQSFPVNSLFENVQLSKVFADGKIFADCIPKRSAEEIDSLYKMEKDAPGFSLEQFVYTHFELPEPHSARYQSDRDKSVLENIETLWNILTRNPDEKKGSLIPLPYPYIVPGGRFGEIYYWDSYFTMLGLQASGKTDMIENMVKNFAYLIDAVGYIPNGNRTYYLGRSQPPFFCMMVTLLSESQGKEVLTAYLPQMETEYRFWMKGSESLTPENNTACHTVRMPGGEILNRYWDENDTPRPESYREDVELASHSSQRPATIYRHLRAGAESGWDFSSRWFRDAASFASIHTTDIVPVDLNCLLYNIEMILAEACLLANNNQQAVKYQLAADKRKTAIQKYCWNIKQGFYTDYDLSSGQTRNQLTLAGAAALFFRVATTGQALMMKKILQEQFLKPGGAVTTLNITGQQWDAPNGWAPLQWITINGLENYGFTDLATTIAQRWIKLNTDVYNRTGKLMEKYNVEDPALEAGGGEYPGQDGFGWTNGVLLSLMNKYGHN